MALGKQRYVYFVSEGINHSFGRRLTAVVNDDDLESIARIFDTR